MKKNEILQYPMLYLPFMQFTDNMFWSDQTEKTEPGLQMYGASG